MSAQITAAALETLARVLGLRQLVVVGFDGDGMRVESWGDSIEDAALATAASQNVARFIGWPEALLSAAALRELENLRCERAAAVAALVSAPAPDVGQGGGGDVHRDPSVCGGPPYTWAYARWFEGPRTSALRAAGILVAEKREPTGGEDGA